MARNEEALLSDYRTNETIRCTSCLYVMMSPSLIDGTQVVGDHVDGWLATFAVAALSRNIYIVWF